MAQVKQTTRRFVLSVPSDKTEKTIIRTFIRAADGAEYPVNREIEVQKFEPKIVEFKCLPWSSPSLEQLTEQYVLKHHPVGTLALETDDIVTFVDEE